jgi:plastocyanin
MRKILIIILAAILVFGAIFVLQKFTANKPLSFLKNLFKSQSLSESKQTWPSAEKQLNIFIRDQQFLPNYNAVQKGTNVTWYNDDDKAHNVTGESWSSGQLLPSQNFSKVFDQPGDYKYHCSIHPEMTGEIVVQ